MLIKYLKLANVIGTQTWKAFSDSWSALEVFSFVTTCRRMWVGGDGDDVLLVSLNVNCPPVRRASVAPWPGGARAQRVWGSGPQDSLPHGRGHATGRGGRGQLSQCLFEQVSCLRWRSQTTICSRGDWGQL